MIDVKIERIIGSAAGLAALAMLLALIAGGAAVAAMAGFQRMVIAPGCYTVAAGAAQTVPAYCLDRAMAAPTSGAILANAPTPFGTTLVKTAGGTALALQAALEQHMLQVEGAGDDGHVQLRNLTGQPLEICITTPTVVMANGDYATGDLPKLYDIILRVLSKGAPAAKAAAKEQADNKAGDVHAQLQEELWEAVHDASNRNAEEEAYKSLSRRLQFGTVEAPDAASPAGSAPSRSKCAGETSNVEVCASR